METVIRVNSKLPSRVNRARLASTARRVLRAEKKKVSLTIFITDNKEIRALNRKFHATDAATDVLAFPYSPGRGEPAARPYIGDVIISYDRARVQARVARWRIADELDLLAVHGILHLLGYDDTAPRARKKMWARQEKLLRHLVDG